MLTVKIKINKSNANQIAVLKALEQFDVITMSWDPVTVRNQFDIKDLSAAVNQITGALRRG